MKRLSPRTWSFYLSEAGLDELLSWAHEHAVTIEKLPQARSVPLAVLRWKGLEVNALTASQGLPPSTARSAAGWPARGLAG